MKKSAFLLLICIGMMGITSAQGQIKKDSTSFLKKKHALFFQPDSLRCDSKTIFDERVTNVVLLSNQDAVPSSIVMKAWFKPKANNKNFFTAKFYYTYHGIGATF